MSNSIVALLRLLQGEISGPRDWYEIQHCKTGRNKSYFGVRACIWKEGPHESWPTYFYGESVSLPGSIKQVLREIEEGKQDA